MHVVCRPLFTCSTMWNVGTLAWHVDRVLWQFLDYIFEPKTKTTVSDPLSHWLSSCFESSFLIAEVNPTRFLAMFRLRNID